MSPLLRDFLRAADCGIPPAQAEGTRVIGTTVADKSLSNTPSRCDLLHGPIVNPSDKRTCKRTVLSETWQAVVASCAAGAALARCGQIAWIPTHRGLPFQQGEMMDHVR
mgnify:CR=1 FL=1